MIHSQITSESNLGFYTPSVLASRIHSPRTLRARGGLLCLQLKALKQGPSGAMGHFCVGGGAKLQNATSNQM